MAPSKEEDKIKMQADVPCAFPPFDPDRDGFEPGTFPSGFMWGVASSAYQIEGGWNEDGKGPSIMDVHFQKGAAWSGHTGDVTCDSYHKYREDVRILSELGVSHYRFSLSWPRIFPDGTRDSLNPDGVRYYNSLIDELLAHGIVPFVTLYHWDMPLAVEEKHGGWLAEDIVELFNDYARFCFSEFGDRVKHWVTFNEPWSHIVVGSMVGMLPRVRERGREGMYASAHTMIKAHGKAWHTYDKEFRAKQGGKLGITLSCTWAEPKNPECADDLAAAERFLQFHMGWFAHPIFLNGDYPEVMKEYIGKRSAEEGLAKSRLPEFTAEEKAMLKGTADFLGLNYYTARLTSALSGEGLDKPDLLDEEDGDVHVGTHPDWPAPGIFFISVVPWGFRKVLNYMKNRFQVPLIFVTENGYHEEHMAEGGQYDMKDTRRSCYHAAHINELRKAMVHDGVNVQGYTVWCLMDNLEWESGFSQRMGLYYVDFNDPDRKRNMASLQVSEVPCAFPPFDEDRDGFSPGVFPPGFLWGAASAAFQIEGAYNDEGKGPSILDPWLNYTKAASDGTTAKVTCDSYHRYREDVRILSELGASHYRFSISWPRLFPDGTRDSLNPDGVRYYNSLINELVAHGIVPFVTLYHWDMPLALMEKYRGWLDEALVELFGDYARFCFSEFGDRVKHWATFNEPWSEIAYGSKGILADTVGKEGKRGVYAAARTVLKAHATAWHIYDREFRAKQDGKVGLALGCTWGEPRDPHSADDVAAAERFFDFNVGWFAHPLFVNGDYPDTMKEYVMKRSLADGLTTSDLPEFSAEEKALLKGSADFLGMNYYTARLVSARAEGDAAKPDLLEEDDADVHVEMNPDWPVAGLPFISIVPWALRKALSCVTDRYRVPLIFVTENGLHEQHQGEGQYDMKDTRRSCYHAAHINELRKAILQDGVNVQGYTVWCLMDNFEWNYGHTQKMGLYYVDFTDPERKRVPKESAGFYRDVIKHNGFPDGASHTRMVQGWWEKRARQTAGATEK
ncbi:PREDICTED: lactase-phlorizin hydrolase-like [Branchiostoma belcheri]|uniref:Lactase-phlorizin hydrolase-like n=1 Tax=Branchiostoma belcheri TaxID=7741 RepID=A0A6P4YK15_BRABE|nr:PREDICTED: lactase-phlorizin hydrolase-like [Branchiostoma belcheri]